MPTSPRPLPNQITTNFEVWNEISNDDNGSLFTRGERLVEGDLVRIEGESRVRRVTYVMGSIKKGWRACFKGQGAVPTGTVRWCRATSGGAFNSAVPQLPAPIKVAENSQMSIAVAPAEAPTPLPTGLADMLPPLLSLDGLSSDTAIFGFDSAWSARNRGAICGMKVGTYGVTCLSPRAVSFDEALEVIASFGAGCALRLIAIDQPLVVPNATGRRPVEALIATAIGRRGGGVQPANRSRTGMFDESAPIWTFLKSLGADLDPDHVPKALAGTFAIEVYPAAANICLFQTPERVEPLFKYNPQRGTFRLGDWAILCERLREALTKLDCVELAKWCLAAGSLARPRKADQDIADALVCLLVGHRWWSDGPTGSQVVGNLESGYMVIPTTSEFRSELRVQH